jgi:L-cysteate sulfo-lyase
MNRRPFDRLVRDGRWTCDQDIVFIHTGGTPALFAYRQLFDQDGGY